MVSVNVGSPAASTWKSTGVTGFSKRPVASIEVRAPGPKRTGLGSGVVGDFIGDTVHHGGDAQAVYAVAREDLDAWQRELSRALPDGGFGENLTTRGIDVNEALVGERWTIGEGEEAVVLRVTGFRTPCATFAGVMGVPNWVRRFTAAGRPGAYLAVVQPGIICAGAPITVSFRPDHDVTVALYFRASTTERALTPRLVAARDYLDEATRTRVLRAGTSGNTA